MKKTIFLLLFVSLFTHLIAQSYVGMTTQSVRLRSAPEISPDNILETLPASTEIFVSGTTDYNGFYEVIDVRTNRYGYIASKYIYLLRTIQEDTSKVFTETGTTESVNPQAEIFNDTEKEMTLKLNDDTYYFSPYETRTITLSESGMIHYVASASMVIPAIGREYFESNHSYTWKFWITTKY